MAAGFKRLVTDGRQMSRRSFFAVFGWFAFLGAGAVALVQSVRFMQPNALYEDPAAFKAEVPSAYSVGSTTVLTDKRVVINRDSDGFYAISLICTHLGCTPRYFPDVTSDLVFPVMFGVAPDDVAAHIIARLSDRDFWTEAGIRTTPRDAPNYTPNGGWGLLGGVWVGVTFWYARAAAKYQPTFMDHALATSFRNYSRDPKKNNTVPGQFSEWLHGETLVNDGMMLSPWDPPRYLCAAIEGVAGLLPEGDSVRCWPHLAPDWKWMGVQDLLYRGHRITWFAVRVPELQMYTNFHFQESSPYLAYDEDISASVHVTGDSGVSLGLRQGEALGLWWEDVDLDAGTLRVRRQQARTRGPQRAAVAP